MKILQSLILLFTCLGILNSQEVSIDVEQPQDNANGEFAFSTYGHWPKSNLTYFIVNSTADVSMGIQGSIFRQAFDTWEEFTDLEFTEVNSSNADLTVAFISDPSHFQGTTPLAWAKISASGGVISHTAIEYNDQTFQFNNTCSGGYDLLTIAIHEIGHALGLNHSDVRESIMYPFIGFGECKWTLHQDDIDGIQSLYEFSGHWNPYKTLVADINGDGKDDVIWNETTNERNRVYVGLSNGDCTFSFLQSQDFLGGGWGAFKTLIGDVNGDGLDDMIWNGTTVAGNRVYVGLSNGDGTFSLNTSQDFLSGGWDPYKTLIGDVNGDGFDDLIWNETSITRNRVYIGLSNGDGTFNLNASQDFLSGGWDPYKTLIGDINGDDFDDLIWNETSVTRNRLYVGLSNGDGTFNLSPSQNILNGGWQAFVTLVGDIDGDNKDDIVWNGLANINRTYTALSNGNGSFDLKPSQDRQETGWAEFRTLFGDFNGDNKFEPLWNGLRTINRVYTSQSEEDGILSFNSLQDHPNQGWYPYKSLVGDFNGDGKSDILWNETRARNRLYIANGATNGIEYCSFQDHIFAGDGMDLNISDCIPNYSGTDQLTGLLSVSRDYKTNGEIISEQILLSSDNLSVINYNAGISISLLENFEVKAGVTFNAFLEGCTN